MKPGWKHYVERLQGSTVSFDIGRYATSVATIAGLEASCRALSDTGLLQRGNAIRERVLAGESPSSLRDTFFALAREAARRALSQRPFDEQVVAGLALDDGRVVEMQTGEGKTLAAVMPAALNALTGRGVHVLTFNDYLARRDAEWMGPVYRMLGLSVGSVQDASPAGARRASYQADITYVTAKEAGFDYLRDLLVLDRQNLVHRPFNFALVDEADSLLIDEARVPLVIAGRMEGGPNHAPRLAQIVSALTPGIHFDTDEYSRDVELTEAGIEQVERLLGSGALHDPLNIGVLTELNCALHARVLLRRDVDYIVRDGRIEILDEFTGRVIVDRHWPDGLQAAVEAKEGLARRSEGRILGSLTLQRFLRGYPRLCGMTGTARSAAAELRQLYGVEIVVIPTHEPMVRVDHDDLVFTHREAKERAVVDEVYSAHAEGRPVLIGTLTVIESERLAERLRTAGIDCDVLNAKNDADEAAIVARAGAYGAVTISTNMAGRGTDIRLGGADERDRERIAALGGLYVIGTNRHESRRVDLQLRGRAGRQGDPGESRFFISLDDELLVRYGIRDLIPRRFFPADAEHPIENPIVRREIARAQRIVEGQNLEIRKTLARYAGVLDEQHRRLMERREAMLLGVSAPELWLTQPERRASLVAGAGESAVTDAERAVTLACIDRAWSDHLALCADIREGIHLVRLGGEDPLTRFTAEAIEAYAGIDQAIDDAVLEALEKTRCIDGRLDLTGTGLQAPASTWTYLVNDDPFRNTIGALLTGLGGKSVAIFSAAVLMPLLILWGAVERLWPRRRVRR